MSEQTATREVVVVGAGLVGCLAALHLARRGYSVQLFESRPAAESGLLSGGRSLHLVISARGFRGLEGVGIDREVRALALPLRGRTIHAEDGSTTFHLYDAAERTIHAVSRAALNQLLVQACMRNPRVRLAFGQRCIQFNTNTATLTFEAADTRERYEVPAERVLGADGAFSALRFALLKREYFDYSQQYLPYAYKELGMRGAKGDEWPLVPDTIHVWPRGKFMITAFPNPDRTFAATLVLPRTGAPTFDSIRTPGDLERLFGAHFCDALPLMPDLSEHFFSRPASSLISIRCAPWTWEGRVALIGDAAHAMVPFLGQGMNAGFEDVTVLGECLERSGDDWASALAEYEALRRVNCDTVTELSRAHFSELSEHVGDPRFALKKRVEQRLQRMFPERFVPLYSRLAFSCMPYAEIQRVNSLQEALVQRVMAVPGIEGLDPADSEGLLRKLARELEQAPAEQQPAARRG
jgi:kynurenine 3-monooxygenase